MAEYSHCGVNFDSVAAFINYVVQDFPNQSGVYVINIRGKAEQENFLKMAESIGEACSLIFEEASKFCNPKMIPDILYDLIHYGRHEAVNLVFTARRAAELNRNVTSQSTAIISFQQTEPNDISILKSSFSDAKNLPDLTYDPENPEINEYLVLGHTSLL